MDSTQITQIEVTGNPRPARKIGRAAENNGRHQSRMTNARTGARTIMRGRQTLNNFARWTSALMLAAVPLLPARAVSGKEFDIELKGRQSEGYDKALCRMWIPDGVQHVRAVILTVTAAPGPAEPHWEDLADRTESALMWYSTYTSEETRLQNIRQRRNRPEDRGGQINNALAEFAQKTGHPELKNVPLALCSHLTSLRLFLSYLDENPERIICLMAVYPRDPEPGELKVSPEARKIPCCFICTDATAMSYNEEINILFEESRKKGAPWCYGVHRGAPPAPQYLNAFAIPYVEACIQQRPAATVAFSAKPQLKDISPARGWLVDLEERKAYAPATYNKPKGKTGWLPDQKTAELWELVEAGKLELLKREPPPREPRPQHPIADPGK